MKTCKTCKQEKELSSFSKSLTNRDGLSLHCKKCRNSKINNRRIERNKKCKWCDRLVKSKDMCDMHNFRVRTLIKSGLSLEQATVSEPMPLGRKQNPLKETNCKWCDRKIYGRGLCRIHRDRAYRAIKKGATWTDFENTEPQLQPKIKKIKVIIVKPARKPVREIIDGQIQCIKCDVTKPVSEYYPQKCNITGYKYHCKECHNEHIKRKMQSDIGFSQMRKAHMARWNRENRERKREYQNNWIKLNPMRWKELTRRQRIKPVNKVKRNLCKRLRDFVKGKSGFIQIGCTKQELVAHLESKFQNGMTWDNYGEWHIDHIIPCSAFDLTNPNHIATCFHYQNLQPLWAEDNIRKSNKVSNAQIALPI